MSKLINLIDKTQAKIGIIGLGYVGLPLTISFVSKAFQVTGFDIDQEKVNKLNNKLIPETLTLLRILIFN